MSEEPKDFSSAVRALLESAQSGAREEAAKEAILEARHARSAELGQRITDLCLRSGISPSEQLMAVGSALAIMACAMTRPERTLPLVSVVNGYTIKTAAKLLGMERRE